MMTAFFLVLICLRSVQANRSEGHGHSPQVHLPLAQGLSQALISAECAKIEQELGQ
jgi:hypothetical protein